MKSPAGDQFDVIVIGGGPAGATAAALLAGEKWRVLLLEREEFPRFHIGESLMTETYWLFQRLGILEKLRGSDFPEKYSVQFFSSSGKASRPFYFMEQNPHPSSMTWQVDRAEFDNLLLERARELGAEVRQGVSVRDLIREGERVVGVRAGAASDPGETAREIRAPVTIDATGQNAFIARRLGILRQDPCLRKASAFAHYRGGLRDSGVDEGATLIINAPGKKGWFWYIPLSRDRVSVGVVGDPDIFKGRGGPEAVLDEEIQACRETRRRLAGAERISPVRVLRDFSYRAETCAGDGWVLIGDAFGFLDPIYSSGVFLALKSGELAAGAVNGALREKEFSRERLGAFEPELLRGMEAIRKLINAFYTHHFNFGQFLKRHPHHRRGIVDILTGNVFQDGLEDFLRDLALQCALPGSPQEVER